MQYKTVDDVAETLRENYFNKEIYHIPNISDAKLKEFLNKESSEYISLLHEAVSLDFPEALKKFIALGADPNFAPPGKLLPLFFANSITTIKMLLEAGADVNLEHDNCSYLRMACSVSNYELVELLVKHDERLIQKLKTYFDVKGDSEKAVMEQVESQMNECEFLVLWPFY